MANTKNFTCRKKQFDLKQLHAKEAKTVIYVLVIHARLKNLVIYMQF